MPGRFARSSSVAFCGLQVLAICGSVIAATREIESIVWTGPIFSVTGLLVALTAAFTRVRSTALFGLSTPAVSMLVFLIIYSLRWGPPHARLPVPWMLFVYELLAIPVGLWAMFRTLTIHRPPPTFAIRQFNLRTLFAITFAVAIACVPARWAITQDSAALTIIAITLALATLAGLALVFVLAGRALGIAPR